VAITSPKKLAYIIEWRKANKERVQAAQQKYREQNREKTQEASARWQKEHPEKALSYTNKRRKKIEFKLEQAARARISSALKKSGASYQCSFWEALGCTASELATYIEAKLQAGMTWENYGEWEMDHIRAVALFDLTDKEQYMQCFHHTNIQPLWKPENRLKSNKSALHSTDTAP
jgi:hypothetical protein